MYRRFYTVEMVYGTGKVDKEFGTYEEAYDHMCKNYVRELNEGYTPTLYKILEHQVSNYAGATNEMIHPTWS